MNDNDIPVTPEEEELFKEIQSKVSREEAQGTKGKRGVVG